MNAMMFLFRAVNSKEWETINMQNFQDKMEFIDKLKSKDFQDFNYFNPNVEALMQE